MFPLHRFASFQALGAVLVLCFLTSCGSDDEANTLASKGPRRPLLPEQVQVRGVLPDSVALTSSDFGGGQVLSLSFTSQLAFSPSLDVADVYWSRSAQSQVLSPPLQGCELTGFNVYLPKSGPQAEVHLWGWESGEACLRFFESVKAQGIAWRAEKVPGVYGETIRQADFEFRPTNRFPENR